jgi:hypothetical protein
MPVPLGFQNWYCHVKQFAATHGLTYSQALAHPNIRCGYVSRAKNPVSTSYRPTCPPPAVCSPIVCSTPICPNVPPLPFVCRCQLCQSQVQQPQPQVVCQQNVRQQGVTQSILICPAGCRCVICLEKDIHPVGCRCVPCLKKDIHPKGCRCAACLQLVSSTCPPGCKCINCYPIVCGVSTKPKRKSRKKCIQRRRTGS